jgi:hypothetical protein
MKAGHLTPSAGGGTPDSHHEPLVAVGRHRRALAHHHQSAGWDLLGAWIGAGWAPSLWSDTLYQVLATILIVSGLRSGRTDNCCHSKSGRG